MDKLVPRKKNNWTDLDSSDLVQLVFFRIYGCVFRNRCNKFRHYTYFVLLSETEVLVGYAILFVSQGPIASLFNFGGNFIDVRLIPVHNSDSLLISVFKNKESLRFNIGYHGAVLEMHG